MSIHMSIHVFYAHAYMHVNTHILCACLHAHFHTHVPHACLYACLYACPTRKPACMSIHMPIQMPYAHVLRECLLYKCLQACVHTQAHACLHTRSYRPHACMGQNHPAFLVPTAPALAGFVFLWGVGGGLCLFVLAVLWQEPTPVPSKHQAPTSPLFFVFDFPFTTDSTHAAYQPKGNTGCR